MAPETPKRVLLTGAAGQLGHALRGTLPSGYELIATDYEELDISKRKTVRDQVAEINPACLINAAAYTDVDEAESNPETAYAVNKDGAVFLAQAASKVGARFIQISTDYVFNGRKATPYLPDDETDPVNVYGSSKLAGETGVRDALDDQCVILRTAWVYGASGKNFVNTMLKLIPERNPLRVVADQIGTPTWTGTLSRVIWRAVERPELAGIYHYTDAGVASWYDFAVAIAEEAQQQSLLQRTAEIHPVTADQYPRAATRPAYSILDSSATWQDFEILPTHWRTNLRTMLQELSTDTDNATAIPSK